MGKKRKSVVFSDSNSDEDFSEPKKSTVKRGKTVKEKPVTPKKTALSQASPILVSPPQKSPASQNVPRQMSLEEAFKRQPTHSNSKTPVQKNTLDRYFQKTPQPMKENKVEISVDAFFAKSNEKILPVLKSEVVADTPKETLPVPTKTESKPQPVPAAETAAKSLHKVSPLKTVNKPVKKASRKYEMEFTPTPVAPAPAVPNAAAATEEEKDLHPSDAPQIKKRLSNFLAFKNRDGPQALGSRVVPKGSATCLKGLTFVVTGVLECVDRDELKSQVESMGGKVTGSVSKRTSYVVVGRDPGESKLTKAEQCNVPQLSEEALYQLLEEKTGKSSLPSSGDASSTGAEPMEVEAVEIPPPPVVKIASTSSDVVKQPGPNKAMLTKKEIIKHNTEPVIARPNATADVKASSSDQGGVVGAGGGGGSDLWVDKYRPDSMSLLVGQYGPKSCANKLLAWLTNWHSNFEKGLKAKAYNPSAGWGSGSDEGVWARAALLSGPPGIGKTTTVQVVCSTLGFSAVELNASDSRNKRSLKDGVAQSLSTHTLTELMSTKTSNSSSGVIMGKKHCLVMDEVDGMAGNEDRGGMNELIQFIKTTRIPIICMCNDRQSQKVRSLANYCLDLRFQRPRMEQIKALVLRIASRERLTLPADALNDVIQASNQDIRQVINNLQMWKSTSLESGQMKEDAVKAQKDLHFSPFEVVHKVFSPNATASIHDKTDLFFQDYNFGPLFVQENYIHVRPLSAQNNVGKTLACLSNAADAIAMGDVVSKKIRNGNNWGLLPTQAIFSSVLPGEYMRGTVGHQVSFPSWLGKNSSQGKVSRLSVGLCGHLRLATNRACQPTNLILDYAPLLATKLSRPLREGDVTSVMACLEHYDLLKEDMDSILEITQWPNRPDRLAGVDSKVKAALTRAYNKSAHLLPYAASSGVGRGKASAGRGNTNNNLEGGDGEELLAEADDDAVVVSDEETLTPEEALKRDNMIMIKKPKKVAETKPAAAKAPKAKAAPKKAVSKKK